MAEISLIADTESGVTELSNIFIEHYMGDANEVQLKLYIYLLKLRSTGSSVEFSDIVDFLDFSERDVMRALHYWEDKMLLSVTYGNEGRSVSDDMRKGGRKSARAYAKKADSIRAIKFADPAELLYNSDVHASGLISMEPEYTDEDIFSDYDEEDTADKTCREKRAGDADVKETEALSESCENEGNVKTMDIDSDKIKSNYTVADIRDFKKNKDTKTLITAAQMYFGRPISSSELTSIMFLSYTLKMREDLIDYLLQYCVENKRTDFSFVEKTAIKWCDEGIDSCEKAKEYCRNLIKEPDKDEKYILELLGKTGNYARGELDAVHRWFCTYGFTRDIIEEACNRTVVNVEDHRIAYAEKILRDWFHNGVRALSDIEALDEEYRKKKGIPAGGGKTGNAPAASGAKPKTKGKNGTFGNFEERENDFDSLAKKLSGN